MSMNPEALTIEDAVGVLDSMDDDDEAETATPDAGADEGEGAGDEDEESEDGDEDEESEDEESEDEESEDEDEDEESEDEESEDEDEDEDEESEPKTYKFKAAEEEVEVTLDELIKGYQREADYRRKTSAVAREREEVQGLRDTVQRQVQEIEAAKAANAQIIQHLKDPWLKQYQALQQNEELYNTDPGAWAAQEARLRTAMDTMDQIHSAAMGVYTQQQHAARAEYVNNEIQKVLKARPDWSAKDTQQVFNLLSDLGMSESEVREVNDHRLLLGAHELARLRQENTELKAKLEARSERARKVQRVPKQVPKKRGAARTATKASRERFHRSGSIDDAAAFLSELED